MKRLIIIVEGDTEKEFVTSILSPYLSEKGIDSISCYKISKTNGGLTNYLHLKKDLKRAINEENVIVTTLIDYYALPNNFPKYKEAQKIADKKERLTFLEKAIIDDIKSDGYIPLLIPYIQLHEFEALTFTSIDGFRNFFNAKEADFNGLAGIIAKFDCPEDINEGKKTAPSKRLKTLIPSYNKVTDGVEIIKANGFVEVLKKCSRFREWVDSIIINFNS